MTYSQCEMCFDWKLHLQPMREQIQGKGKISGKSYRHTANERADTGQGEDQWEEL